jgi:hypothetical protein
MSISVTVSGEDSTSVILAQALSDAVTISGSSAVEVTTTSGNSATITVSTGDPITITGNYSNYVTGDVVRPPEISDFLTENQINSKITTATGDYNTLANNSFYPKSNPSGYITGVDLSAYATEEFVTGLSGSLQGQISSNNSEIAEIVDVTGSFALKSETGSFISDSETGQFYASSNPSGFITGVDLSALETATGNLDTRVSSNSLDILSVSGLITSNDGDISELQAATGLLVQKSETGSFISESQTGQFYATSNPSGFITGVDLSSYVQDSETGLFLVSGEDAVVNTIGVGGSPDPNIDIHVKSDSAKFLVENTLGGGEWVRFSAGTIGTSMKFSNTASFSIGPVASKTDTSVVDDFYMASNGNVGIGTENPAGKLHIVGSAQGSYIEPRVENTAAIGAAGFAFINSNQEWKMGVNTADTFRIRDHNAGANVFQIESGAPGDSFVIDSNGNVGIGTTSPDQSLHINRGQNAATNIKIENNNAGVNSSAGMNFHSATADGYYFLHGANRTTSRYGLPLADWVELTHGGSDDLNGIVIGTRTDIPVVIGANNNEIARFTDNGVGIGTTTPSEKLEVSGNLMLQQNGVIKNKNNNTQFRFAINDLYLDAGHLRAGYSVGIRGKRGSAKGMEQGSTRNSDLGLYNESIEAVSIRNNGNVDANYNLTVNQNLSVSGESSFSSRPTVNGTGVLLIGEGGGGTVENAVYTTGNQSISGTKSFGKISLSENSFVIETGSFTMSSTHRGATVLLQNSAPMTVTIPAQVSGHTTTFIAETINAVIFATGAGISGFNSFNSANQIAGIYGQAQVIFKSPEYAFLGGNVV